MRSDGGKSIGLLLRSQQPYSPRTGAVDGPHLPQSARRTTRSKAAKMKSLLAETAEERVT